MIGPELDFFFSFAFDFLDFSFPAVCTEHDDTEFVTARAASSDMKGIETM